MENTKQNNKEERKSFLTTLSEHMKRIADLFSKSDNKSANDKIIFAGRTEEEKDQLKEMCEEIDDYHRDLKELRGSELSPGKWLDKKIDKELEAADSEVTHEDKDNVKEFVMNEFKKDIEAQTDALSDELDITSDNIKGGDR